MFPLIVDEGSVPVGDLETAIPVGFATNHLGNLFVTLTLTFAIAWAVIHIVKYVGIEIASSSLWDRLSVGSRLAWALRGIGILGIILLVTVYAPLFGTAGTVSDTWQTPYFGLHIVRFEIVLGYVLTGTALALGGSHLRHRSPIVLAALTLAVVPGYLLLVVQEATVLSALWHSLTALPIVALPVLGAIDREGTTRGRTLTTAVFVVFVLVGTLIVVRIPYVEYIPRDDPSWVLLPLGYAVLVHGVGLPLYLMGYDWENVAGSPRSLRPPAKHTE